MKSPVFHRPRIVRAVLLCFALLTVLPACTVKQPRASVSSVGGASSSLFSFVSAAAAGSVRSASSKAAESAVASKEEPAVSAKQKMSSTPAASSSRAASKPAAQPGVTLSIDARRASSLHYGWILGPTLTQIQSGDTVYSLLRRVCQQKHWLFDAQMTGSTAYIDNLDGLSPFDMGPESGWVFRLNRKYATFSCSASEAKLKNGDVVEWIYTIDDGATEARVSG